LNPPAHEQNAGNSAAILEVNNNVRSEPMQGNPAIVGRLDASLDDRCDLVEAALTAAIGQAATAGE
jgi:hypothetical protein